VNIAGLAALKLILFRLPSVDVSKMKRFGGHFGPAAFGLAVDAAYS